MKTESDDDRGEREQAERKLERAAANHSASYGHLLRPTNRVLVALRDYQSVDEITTDQSSQLLDQVHEIALDAAREFAASTNPALNIGMQEVDIDVVRLCEKVCEQLSWWRAATDSVQGLSVELKVGAADEDPYWIELDPSELADFTEHFRELRVSSVMIHRPLEDRTLEAFGELISTLESLRDRLKRVTAY